MIRKTNETRLLFVFMLFCFEALFRIGTKVLCSTKRITSVTVVRFGLKWTKATLLLCPKMIPGWNASFVMKKNNNFILKIRVWTI